jgi:hypothetical protein
VDVDSCQALQGKVNVWFNEGKHFGIIKDIQFEKDWKDGNNGTRFHDFCSELEFQFNKLLVATWKDIQRRNLTWSSRTVYSLVIQQKLCCLSEI